MARAKPRPFVDTNVFSSGLYRPGSHPAAILERHIEGSINIVVSRQVLEELGSTIRAKRPDLLPQLETFLTNAPPEICTDPSPEEVRRARLWLNATDAPILAAAIKAGADCLVTGNTRHFTPEVADAARIAIFTPAPVPGQPGAQRVAASLRSVPNSQSPTVYYPCMEYPPLIAST